MAHLSISAKDSVAQGFLGPLEPHLHELVVLLDAALRFENDVHQAHHVPVHRSAEGDRRDAGGLQLLGGSKQLVIGFRLFGNAGLLEAALAVVDRPRP